MENQLTLRFTGVADLKPQMLRAKDLAEIIENFEAALVAAVIARNPTIKREQIAVPLISVNDQSIGLVFAPNLPELTYPAAFRIAEALATHHFSSLPETVLSPLRGLVRFVRQRGCIAEVQIKRGSEMATTSITPQTRIEAFVPVDGETILYGQVIRVGGVDPKVELKPLTGKALFCSTTEEIAIQLANRLYQQVSLQGCATWDQETLEVKEFRITKVLPYAKKPLIQTFKLLKERAHGAFDSIEDINQYVTTLRHGED